VDEGDIKLLKSRIDQIVWFHCKDGEQIVGTILFVSENEQDVTYDLISSNRMAGYESNRGSAFRLTFEEIDFVTLPQA
jgi:hypothetical protein